MKRLLLLFILLVDLFAVGTSVTCVAGVSTDYLTPMFQAGQTLSPRQFKVKGWLRSAGLHLPFSNCSAANSTAVTNCISSVTFGDSITATTASTMDAPSAAWDLPDKGTPPTNTSADYITIQSSDLASLPSGTRVTAADASHMPKLRAVSGRGVFQVAANAKYWKLVGLEITNVSSGTSAEHVQDLIGSIDGKYTHSSKPAHFIIDRCYIHPQEDGLATSDPFYDWRSASHGVVIWAADVSITNSRLSGFFGAFRHARRVLTDGVVNGTTTVTSATGNFDSSLIGLHIGIPSGPNAFSRSVSSITNSTTLEMSGAAPTSASGQTIVIGLQIDSQAFTYADAPGPLLVDNNYIESWYGALYGGTDSDTDNFGTVAASPAPTQTSFAVTTTSGSAPVAGDFIAVANSGKEYSACEVASVSGGTVTCVNRLSWNGITNDSVATFTCATNDVCTSTAHGREGNDGIIFASATGTPPGGLTTGTVYYVRDVTTDTFKLSTTPGGAAIDITSVGTGTNTMWGGDMMTSAPVPVAGAAVRWRGFVPDGLTITHNTFNVDATDATFLHAMTGEHPKGFEEFKAGTHILHEGNILQGWHTTIGFGLQNQQGSAPWTTIQHVIVRNNFFKDHAQIVGPMSLTGYSRLTPIGGDVLIENNLAIGSGSPDSSSSGSGVFWTLASLGAYGPITAKHNTVVSNDTGGTSFVIQLDNSKPSASGAANTNVISGTTTIKDNIMYSNNYGLSTTMSIAASMDTYVSGTNLVVKNNGAVSDGDVTTWFPGSTPLANTAAIVFTNSSGTDTASFRLQNSSPGHLAASDGTDIGVNIDTLNAALAGGGGGSTGGGGARGKVSGRGKVIIH
jgi:hypothetical protein